MSVPNVLSHRRLVTHTSMYTLLPLDIKIADGRADPFGDSGMVTE